MSSARGRRAHHDTRQGAVRARAETVEVFALRMRERFFMHESRNALALDTYSQVGAFVWASFTNVPRAVEGPPR